jgi:hypothetical protein
MAPVLTQNSVVAPTVEAFKGTLLDAATVTDGIEWLSPEALFETYNCMKFEGAVEFCAPNNKDFDQEAGWNDGFLFGAYGGVSCRSVGLDRDEMERKVSEVFQRGESTAVERAFMQTRFVVSNPAGSWPAPTDLTPAGGPVKPEVGLAILEGYAGSVYVGAPTIHIPRSIGSILISRQTAEMDGNVMRTHMGSKIAAGAGYDYPNTGPTGAEAAAGEKWLYATGEVVIRRGNAIVRQAMSHTDNEVYVLAERAYVGAADCFAAAVRVTLT